MRPLVPLVALLLAAIAVAGYSLIGPAAVDTLILGDSIVTTNGEQEFAGFSRIAIVAHSGDAIVDQKSAYNFSRYKGTALKAVIIMVGVNDIHVLRHDSAAIERDLRELVNTVHAGNPGAAIYVSTMSPAKRYFDGQAGGAVMYATWQAVNRWLAASPPANARVILDASNALNDGADALPARYDSGDGLHPNCEGRKIIGERWRMRLEADGVLQ